MVLICSECGKENLNDTTFCMECGNKLESVSRNELPIGEQKTILMLDGFRDRHYSVFLTMKGVIIGKGGRSSSSKMDYSLILFDDISTIISKDLWGKGEIKIKTVNNRKFKAQGLDLHSTIHFVDTVEKIRTREISIDEVQSSSENDLISRLNNEMKNRFLRKQQIYKTEAKLADKLYKAYITDGLSRLEKVNGRFLASQTMKLDTLIEQNEKIIDLLEKLIETNKNK